MGGLATREDGGGSGVDTSGDAAAGGARCTISQIIHGASIRLDHVSSRSGRSQMVSKSIGTSYARRIEGIIVIRRGPSSCYRRLKRQGCPSP